jgi:hypothetical protein
MELKNPFEDPINFYTTREVDGVVVEYRNTRELGQGGPTLGSLYLNGKPIGGDAEFGPPPLHVDGVLFVPMFSHRWFSTGYVLCRIDLPSGKLTKIGKPRPFMWLRRKEGNRIYFYEDMGQRKEGFIELPHVRPEPK